MYLIIPTHPHGKVVGRNLAGTAKWHEGSSRNAADACETLKSLLITPVSLLKLSPQQLRLAVALERNHCLLNAVLGRLTQQETFQNKVFNLKSAIQSFLGGLCLLVGVGGGDAIL